MAKAKTRAKPKTKPKPKIKALSNGLGRLRERLQYKHELWLVLLAEAALVIGIIMVAPWRSNAVSSEAVADVGTERLISRSLLKSYKDAQTAVGQFTDAETTANLHVVSDTDVQTALSRVALDLSQQSYTKAHRDLAALQTSLSQWQTQLKDAVDKRQQAAATATAAAAAQTGAQTPPPTDTYLTIPILMYHYTPSNFESELQTIQARGYTAVTFDQVVGALHKQQTLPAKPVVITFDDGYANQMQAFELLKKYNMKATFYIIDGGERSNWCIGAGRQYDLPSQPANGCGDSYLTWDQVRTLDTSGLITIGAHTIDHLNLASLSSDDQWYEINQGKLELEAQLGHAVADFAYPYGSFNATTLSLVAKAGFRSAVTTIPGSEQAYGSQYTLHRIRTATALP